MELLEYNSTIRWQEDKNRVNYYYDLYQYKLRINLYGIHFFRYVTNEHQFDSRLQECVPTYIRYLSSTHLSNTHNSEIKKNNTLYTIAELLFDKMGPNAIDSMRSIVDWKNKTNTKVKLKVSHNLLEIYVNDNTILSDLIKAISKVNMHYYLFYVKKIKDYEPGIIYHRIPKNKYRIYFNFHRFSSTESSNFAKFIISNDFILSRSLANTMFYYLGKGKQNKRYGRYLSSYDNIVLFTHYYVDFDDDKMITLLALFDDSLIRKVFQIKKR